MFGRLRRGWKWYKALGQVEKAWKESMTMDDKPILKSWVNIGLIFGALIPISALVLPAIGLGELVAPVAKILTGLATIFGGIGLRRLAGRKLVIEEKRAGIRPMGK